MEKFKEMMEHTQKAMARNLAQELYGPNATVTFLGQSIKHKRETTSEKIKRRIGEWFLRRANSLGVYNDDY